MTTTEPEEAAPTAEEALADLVAAVEEAKGAMPPGQAKQDWAVKVDQALQEAKLALDAGTAEESPPEATPTP